MKPAAYFEDAAPRQDLNRHSLRGGAISMGGLALNMVVQVCSTIILARLLMPEDFGLVAMVSAVTGFMSIFVDLGTRDAVAQRHSITEGEVSALFWITLGTGLTLATITALSAPLIARFYGDPRLGPITMALSATFVLPALYFQQHALRRRSMMFRTLALIDVGANLLATTLAIALAYHGYGYWALIWKLILSAFFSGAAIWVCCGWWPKRPAFTAGVKDLLKFGLNITGFIITDGVARSADRVGLGYTAGPHQLGYYQNALVVYDNALQICASLHNVATATLTKLRGDRPALKRAWSAALSSLVYFAAPAYATLAVVGHDLVILLLGSKWAAAGAVLSILALRGPANVVERTLGWLHIIAERPDRWRHWGVLNCGVTIVALLCGLPFGPIGVAAAYVAATYLLFIPGIAYAGKPLGIGATDAWATVGPQVITALGAAGVGFLVGHTLLLHTAPLPRLLMLGFLCCAVYLVTMTVCFRMTKPLTVAVSLVRTRVSG